MDRLGDGLVYLCRASGEGSHDFRVCTDEAGVGAFYQEMTGEDEGGGIDSLWRDFRNPDCWGSDGTALELELYCAKFEVWKVDARQLAVGRPESAALTIEDKRWRFLEHGCQWVGFNPINGNQYSFDPRIVSKAPGVGLLYMREVVDAAMEEHLKILREGINAVVRR